MKMLILALLLPFFGFAQVDLNRKNKPGMALDSVPGTSVILKNNEVIFQKVYASKLTGDELAEKLFTLVSAAKNFRFDRQVYPAENEFVGKLNCYMVDTKRYGGTMFGTPAIFGYPINATVIVSIKDFKYRVTVTDITFKDITTATKGELVDVLLSDYITKKRRTQIKTGKTDIKVAQFIDLDFSNLFDLHKSNLSDDF